MNQGGEEVRLTAEGEFGHNFRGVADIDYLSSFVFRLAFSETFTQAVNSEVKSDAFLSNATRGFFYNFSMHRYQDFESSTPGDVITILHAPGVELSSVDQPLGRSPFYWSYDAALEGLSRSEPTFSTAPLIGRFDLSPTLSLPLQLRRVVVPPRALRPGHRLHPGPRSASERREAGGFRYHQPQVFGCFGRSASSRPEPGL